MFVERIWPRLWLVVGIAAIFLAASLAGLWGVLDSLTHKLVLGGFALLFVAALITIGFVPWPTREAALRRLELRSGQPHRPASTYEDTLTLNSDDAGTRAVWQAHRKHLSETIQRLRVGRPTPRTDRRDPFAFRALVLLGVVALLVLVGDSARDRVLAAFRFGPAITAAQARLDAWVTPPAYTSKPPLLLVDGARGGLMLAGAEGEPIEVPENSILIARSSGNNAVRLVFEITGSDGEITRQEPSEEHDKADASEIRYTLKRSALIRAMGAGSTLAKWSFVVIPDQPPRIALTRAPQISRRGSMKSYYTMEDDYGIASADVQLERLPPDQGDPRTAWAREENVLKGARLPYERPPILQLRQPPRRAKDKEVWSLHEMATHPWSGMRARYRLVVRDHAGNVGTSQVIEMTVPERRFVRPLARAVVEQRRLLAADSRYRVQVIAAIDALTHKPAGFINDSGVYLGLRSARHRLLRNTSYAGLQSVREQLWHIALRIEYGRNLSDAERRLRELQDQLARALQNGASDQELRELMQQLRQALNDYLRELARQAQRMPQMDRDLLNPNQMMSQQDLQRMLDQLENMMRQGSRQMAQDMLNQLRDLLDRLQMGQMGQMGRRQGQQMMQMLDQMGDIIRREQRLMDDTFRSQRGQNGEQEGQGQGQTPGQLGRRQGDLRERLDRLRRGLNRFGQQAPPQFGRAGEAMDNARRALERGDLETATREQGRALEQLRQGARQMAEQMMRRMGRRFGRGPAGDVPRDPLGRPQRSEGPDLGTTVKVPEEIDIQRAREILEELRRRMGEQNRPILELDYIERLLRRF